MKLEAFWPESYHCYHEVAEKKGYSGTALFSKLEPTKVIQGLGSDEFDIEGRYIECHFNNFVIASAYFPSGSSGDVRQEAKYRFLDIFRKKLESMDDKKISYLFCGDVNIVQRLI